MKQIWKVIPSAPAYEVSNYGEVRRVKPAGGARPGRVLTGWKTKGYRVVALWEFNEERRETVHRLVAEAFLPPPKPGQYQVAHNDGNPANNCVSNLRWASAYENNRDRRIHGTHSIGQRNPMSKLTNAEVRKIRAYKDKGILQREVAEKFAVCRQTVSDIWLGRRWSEVS